MSVTEFEANEVVSRANVNQRISQINANFPVSVANGGTGQTTLASGEILLGNGTSGISSTSTLPVSKGGTGQTSLTSGNILLGNGTSGISSTATLPVSKGGTGATTAADARTNLGISFPLSIDNGGTGALTAYQALTNFGINNNESKSFSANDYASWISQVLDYLKTKLNTNYERPFVFNITWNSHGSGLGFAYRVSSSHALVILYHKEVGTKYYYYNSANSTWGEAPLSIGSGGTGATTALAALQNLGIADVNESDFTASNYSDWLSQVFTYVDSNLQTRRPFVFNAGWANVSYGCGLAYQTLDTGFKFLILFNMYEDIGVKCYYKIPNGNWTQTASNDGIVLYNNDSGTSSAITLSDSAANYGRLKIYYSNDDSQYFDLEIANPNGKSTMLSSNRIVNSNSTLYIKTCEISISGTSITFDSANFGMYRITTSGNSYNHEQKFKIHKVIGYKY